MARGRRMAEVVRQSYKNMPSRSTDSTARGFSKLATLQVFVRCHKDCIDRGSSLDAPARF